jgi:hypothetical protein
VRRIVNNDPSAEFVRLAEQLAQALYPHLIPAKVCLHIHGLAEPVCFPLTGRPTGAAPCSDEFEPNEMQDSILEALEHKALTTDALAAAAGYDRRKLFKKPGGLAQLQDHGLVKNTPGRGYYRPDAPPPELSDGPNGQSKANR